VPGIAPFRILGTDAPELLGQNDSGAHAAIWIHGVQQQVGFLAGRKQAAGETVTCDLRRSRADNSVCNAFKVVRWLSILILILSLQN